MYLNAIYSCQSTDQDPFMDRAEVAHDEQTAGSHRSGRKERIDRAEDGQWESDNAEQVRHVPKLPLRSHGAGR